MIQVNLTVVVQAINAINDINHVDAVTDVDANNTDSVYHAVSIVDAINPLLQYNESRV